MGDDIMDPNAAALMLHRHQQQGAYDANVDYIISDYMERLSTRLNILETELKYAWRALDLLSQEYIKMWERLEKLENLLYEQQSVIAQLLDFYTTGGPPERGVLLEGRLGELEVIREILGNGTVEDGLEEGVDVTGGHASIREIDLDDEEGLNAPSDEAFYRSLNQAYREDLVGPSDVPKQQQLGMIWEEREDSSNNENGSKSGAMQQQQQQDQDVYSAMDYKDYRDDLTPCVSEDDLAQLSRISSIDQGTIDKLNELDRLSTKLQQDSRNIKHLQRKLMESPHKESGSGSLMDKDKGKSKEDVYSEETEPWSFSSNPALRQDQNQELLLLAKTELSSNNLFVPTRPSSRLSVTESVLASDKEVAETLGSGMRTPTSPRRISTCSAPPYTTVTGRLAYSTAVHNVEVAEAALAASTASLHQQAHNPFLSSKNPFYNSSTDMMAMPFETIHSSTPSIFSVKSERAHSPALSVCSIRTRQDGYIGKADSSSPPPPAPHDHPSYAGGAAPVFLSAPDKSISSEPHLKSPRTSPKRKSQSNLIQAAKSDSGLSSMSGWSSLEKSPGSPKNGPRHAYHNAGQQISDGVLQVPVCNAILPGGHHLSAFTTVKSPCCSLEAAEGYGTFVPAPAPASDINVSPRSRPKQSKSDYMYRNDQPAIYSMAGSNRQDTYVYTSSASDLFNNQLAINYPDLVEPYENNELMQQSSRHRHEQQLLMQQQQLLQQKEQLLRQQMQQGSPDMHAVRRRSLNRAFSTSNGTDIAAGLQNHEGYKTAMQRTMFPSGNITDALTYYPQNNSGYQGPNPEYPEGPWQGHPQEYPPIDSASTSSSIRSEEPYSQSPYMQQRQRQEQQQPIYQNQQEAYAWNQRSKDMPYLELDLRNRNVPEYIVQQQKDGGTKYYDGTGVIVSQSGYISISGSNANDQVAPGKSGKKFMKRASLKHAMNSVSNWLPDLNIAKRSRSYSLPGNSRTDEEALKTKEILGHKKVFSKSSLNKKKKKIVSTMSGILQKAKRRSFHHAQSLSDPEQSENEWGAANRAGSVVSVEDDRSEDTYSMHSESVQECENLFERVKNKKDISPPTLSINDDSTNFETVKLMPPKVGQVDSTTPQETDVSDHFGGDEEISGKSTGSGSSTIFPTVADSKRNSSDRSDDGSESGKVFPPVTIGTGSMEFAVSRALGKYRQRQTSSSIPDEPEEPEKTEDRVEVTEATPQSPQPPSSSAQLPQEETTPFKKVPSLIEQKSSDSGQSLENARGENEGSPASSFRAHFGRMPKHQASLEIPGFQGDDDNRSTHSWRSTSRVSSRRQSTEDSIDSEDEWYCYELKKLEEMERQSVLEAEMGAPLQEVEENEESYGPDEEVKKNMSFVLRELRMKSKPMEGVLDSRDQTLNAINSAKRRGNHIDLEIMELEEANRQFQDWSSTEEPVQAQEVYEEDEDEEEDEEYARSERDDSSGATSGPDSPRHSISEFEEAESAIADEFARCKPTAPGGGEQPPVDEVSPADVPKIKIEIPVSVDEDKDKDSGPLGSKWKLLKALKERKAEEKSNQEKVETQPSDREKVGMLGMMQKFYEIHVKT